MQGKISNPYSIKTISKICQTHSFRFSKKFGQNLLVSRETADRIADFAGIKDGSTVLEIGTGFMGLTLALAEKAKEVFSMEVDRNILSLLNEEFEIPKNVTLIGGDALSFDFSKFRLETGKDITVVANLPFNISSQILLRLFGYADLIDSATLAFQRELAERITSLPGRKSYGTLSVLSSLFTKNELGPIVPPEAFFPKPSVDTCIVKLKFNRDIPLKDLRPFGRFLQMAFAYRRKTLLNTVDNMKMGLSKEKAAFLLAEGNFDPNSRLEKLKPSRILDLFKLFSDQNCRGEVIK